MNKNLSRKVAKKKVSRKAECRAFANFAALREKIKLLGWQPRHNQLVIY